jgi:hypothetical protein
LGTYRKTYLWSSQHLDANLNEHADSVSVGKDFIGSQKSNHSCSGGVEFWRVSKKANAQSGQALRPFESQIPGSNPGRSTLSSQDICIIHYAKKALITEHTHWVPVRH